MCLPFTLGKHEKHTLQTWSPRPELWLEQKVDSGRRGVGNPAHTEIQEALHWARGDLGA